MPATAGRVRMPANNRVHSSAALQTHGIWQSAIGYDPYAPNKDDSKNSAQPKASSNEPDAENPYNSYQGLLALARITNTNTDEARGACKKCNRVGHLTFQCRNFLSVKEDAKEKDPEAIQAAVLSELNKIKGKVGKVNGKGKGESEDDSDEEEESDSSDSDADSEMERIIADRFGKKVSNKGRSSRKKKMDDSDENGSGSDSDSEKRNKRGRSKKRRSGKRGRSDSEDESKRKRREKRRKRDESSDEDNERQHRRRKSRKEKMRRRSHRHADDSDSSSSEDSGGRKSRKEKRRRRSLRHADDSDSNTSDDSGGRYEWKSRRSVTPSDFDASGLGDSRVGRGAKRSSKKSRKCRHRV